MAGKADGSVIIDTPIDTSKFKQGMVKMQDQFGKIASAAGKMGAAIKSAFTVKSKGADGLEEKSEEIKISVNDTAKSVEDGMQRINEAMSSGKDTASFDTIHDKIDAISDHLKSLESQDFGFGYAEYDKTYQELVLAEDELKQYKAALTEAAKAERDAAQAGQQASQYVGFFQSALWGLSKAAHAPISMLQLLGNSIKQIPHATLNLVSSGLHKIADAAKTAAKRIGSSLVSGLKKAGAAMFAFHKNTQKSNSSLGSNLKTMLKYTLGIRSLYVLFNKLRSALTEGFKNLAQYDSRTNASISSLMSALTQLKNSFATAFAPILNVVAPILKTFINMISRAVTYVGMLIAALTGQKSFVRAKEVQEDYAASLDRTAGSAKKAEKALEGYLSPIDEINKYNTNDNDASGIGNGSGYTAPTPEDMFETVPIENKLKELADKIRAFFKSEDWEGLGAFIADGLNKGMAKVKEAISWENVSPTITYFVDAFTRAFNSLVDNLDWNLLGETIGEGINTIVNTLNLLSDGIDWQNLGIKIAVGFNGLFNTVNPGELGKLLSQKFRIAIDTAYGFVTTFDWSNFGTWLGSAINGFFGNIDFAKAGQTLSTGIIGALNSLKTAIQTVDWYGLGQKVKEFIVNIDWVGIAESLFYTLGAAIGGLGSFLAGLFGDAVQFVKNYMSNKIQEFTAMGGDISYGLLYGISSAIADIGKWIYDHIFKPFIEGFKSIFGIHSPSTVMAEMGRYIMQGLFNGISSLIDNVVTIFTNIKEKILNKWSEIKSNTLAKWEEIKSGIVNKFNNIKNSITNFASNIKEKVVNAFSFIVDRVSNIWNGLVSIVKSPINKIIGFINNLLLGVQSMQNNIANALNSINIDLPGWLQELTGFRSIGFNMPYWKAPQIPYLATGAVIPPNAPFMAVLGDQKSGNNIEAPENLIRRIVREETANNNGNGGTIHVHVDLNGRQIAEAVLTELELKRIRNGQTALGGV